MIDGNLRIKVKPNEPILVENENIVGVDIDDTMILYPEESLTKEQALMLGYREFEDFTGKKILALPSEKHIRLLEYYHARGFWIIVWSGNGYRHADNILKQLGVRHCANQIMSKMGRYLDDVECSRWMGTRVYLEKGEKL